MKYEDTEVEGIDKQTLRALEQIAVSASASLERRGGIEARSNDDDFPEVSVNAIQDMLERAYLLGKSDASKEKMKNQSSKKGHQKTL